MTTMTRCEHLAWCKQRALAYLEENDCKNAVASMISDLSKHDETSAVGQVMGLMGMMEIQRGSVAVRKWIEGFN